MLAANIVGYEYEYEGDLLKDMEESYSSEVVVDLISEETFITLPSVGNPEPDEYTSIIEVDILPITSERTNSDLDDKYTSITEVDFLQSKSFERTTKKPDLRNKETHNGKCCVSKCRYVSGETLFAFPKVVTYCENSNLLHKAEFERCISWLKATGNESLLYIHPSLIHKRQKICIRHFNDDHLCTSRKRLKKNAVPTKNLPQPICDEKIESYTENFNVSLDTIRKTNFPEDIWNDEIESVETVSCPSFDASPEKEETIGDEVLNDHTKDSIIIEDGEMPATTDSIITEDGEMPARLKESHRQNDSTQEKIHTEDGKVQNNSKGSRRQSTKKCCAPGCNYNSAADIPFFHLPNVIQYCNGVKCINAANYLRFLEWVEVIGNPKLTEGDPHAAYKKYMICGYHFHDSCFTNKFRKRLKKDAFPTNIQSVPLTKQIMEDYKSKMEGWKGLVTILKDYTPMPFSNDEMCAMSFENEIKNLKLNTCMECKEISLVKNTDSNKCKHHGNCWQFSDRNNMDPGVVPPELQDLTFAEEALIARIHPMLSVFKLKGHQYGYRGNIINFSQDVQTFAKKLPHDVNDLTSIINIKYEDKQSNVHDFFVRSGKIRNALIWLRNNNPFYKDIEISEENLNKLPTDGNVIDKFQTIEMTEDQLDYDEDEDLEESEDDENVTGAIHKSCVPNCQTPDQESLICKQLNWPKLSDDPVDEFNTPGYIACAFPTLFPYGKADLRDDREKDVKPSMYFKHLMLYHDERFARHQTFRFFAYNSLQRWTAISDGNVFVRNHPEFKNMTIEKLREMVEQNVNVLKKIMHQGSNIRGSKAYWHARSSELQDMTEQLGLPTIFLTLSCADGHWLDLYRILTRSDDVDHLTEKERRQLVQDNPHIVDLFFQFRVDAFIEHVLQKKYEVTDYWYRVEYQHRGSPHIHGIFWFKDAPDVSNLENESEEKVKEVLDYFSQLITAINPDRHCSEPGNHPCRQRYEHIVDFQEDLAQILNKVQRHTKCSSNYCLRYNSKTKKTECRFKFPMNLNEKASLNKSDVTGDYEFQPSRNDPLLNKYCEFIIQLWRANIDISPVISKKALVAYLTKYISKSEVQSIALDHILNNIINNMTEGSMAVSAIRSIFVKSCAERDISAQEVCHILLGQKLYNAGGRRFVVVNFNSNDWVKVGEDDNEKYGTNFIEKYQNRPLIYENVTLWEAAQKYSLPKWHKAKKHNIVRVFPRINLSPNKDNSEAYYRQKVLLHVPWRNEDDIMTGDKTWKELWEEYHIEDRNELVTELNVEPSNDDDDYEINLQDVEEMENEEFMIISQIGPNQSMEKVQLGNREVDRNYDWSKSIDTYAQYGQINEFESFIETHKKETQMQQNYSDLEVPSVNFSKEQQSVIDLINSQINHIKYNLTSDNIIKRVVVQGKAGTGKSLLIKYIAAKVHTELGPNSYLIGAPTGAAALLINGRTLHSIFQLPKLASQFKPLTGQSARKLSLKFKDVKFLVLDEYSLIGCNSLAMIDNRCKQATGNYDEDFGGLHVYLFGDIKQLPPVKDPPVYSKRQKSSLGKHGKLVFDNIQKAFILQTCHRQQDHQFLDVLDHISDGLVTNTDCQLLSSRFKQNVSDEEKKTFADSIRLFTTKNEVAAYNLKRLSEERDQTGAPVPVAKIVAKHHNKKSENGSLDDASGLPKQLFLAKGCKVMLRTNLWVTHGLVNGALGKVIDILYEKNDERFPRVILCEFEDYNGPQLIPGTKIVPITPMLTTWEDNNEKCSRYQFPLNLAYACSVHKSQGMTLKKAVVNIANEFALGIAYVALSRVKNLQSLLIDPFPNSRLLNIGQSEKAKETIHLRNELINRLAQKT